MSIQNLTVLFAPENFFGPIMSGIGMAEVLRDSGGHRCVFAVTNDWIARLESMGFETILIENSVDVDNEKSVTDSADSNVSVLLSTGAMGNISAFDKAVGIIKYLCEEFIPSELKSDPYMKKIITDLKPSVIITDCLVTLPSIVNSGIPWILSWSGCPLLLDFGYEDNTLQPSLLGLPTNSETEVKEKYRKLLNEEKQKFWSKHNERIIVNGLPPLKEFQLFTPSPFANLYMTPKELDYTDIRQLPNNYHGFDNFKRSGNLDVFEIPEKLKNKSGKLIYLSLGSMGSGNVELMKRLVAILAKSKHRFIVSKGVNHNEYELADNMWGDRTVPQIKVLPIIDLMLTHGGNNTVTETMYFGKPMIVLPLFFDQYDNAQRVMEKGFGVRLDPYECSEQQLLQSIENVLNDKTIAENCEKASKRIQSEKSIEKLTKLVESLVK